VAEGTPLGYKDITINASNLDWIKKDTVYDVARQYTMQAKQSKRDGVHEATETVSGNQCTGDGDEDGNELSFSTVHPNDRTSVPTHEQAISLDHWKRPRRNRIRNTTLLIFHRWTKPNH